MGFLRGILALAEQLMEFLAWRDDWNRTWSPVSYWLAVAMFVTLVLLGLVYGHEAWQWFNEWARRG